MRSKVLMAIYLITTILLISSGLLFPNINYLKPIIIFVFIISLLIFNDKGLSGNTIIFFILMLILMTSLFMLRILFNRGILDENITLIILLIISILFAIVLIVGTILFIKEKFQ